MRALAPALLLPLLLPLLLAPASDPPSPRGRGPRAEPARCEHLPPVRAPRARANDNRTPAGVRRGDTLVVSLVAAPAAWHPEAEDGCALPAFAFAEAGKAPSVPGPLIRVSAGTVLRVSIRNATGRPLWVRGLHDHPSTVREGVALAPDSVREFRFTASTPGTYAYGGALAPTLPGSGIVRSVGPASQLVGGFVVDSAGAPAKPRDRVLVVTRWMIPNPNDSTGPLLFVTNAVNGKSWPHTEQLAYAEGDSVRWRVINGTSSGHPMHLHGFYFNVDAKGTFTGDTALARPRLVVTEPMAAGQTMLMSWLAERPGNWLFHCHLIAHMSARQRLDRLSDSASAALGVRVAGGARRPAENGNGATHTGHGNHAIEGMAGLIVGVRVTPVRGGRAASAPAEPPRRTLRLFANQRAGVFEGGAPGYGFVLQEGDREPARDSVRLPGSPIILRRGEPVQITVHNRLTLPLSVHWHGLELDSYFDGVGDWSGSAGSIAPPVAPGDSFVVRLTPPRAGTFMYHVHGEEGRELASGLYGALIVRDGAASLDTLVDQVVLISDAGAQPEGRAFVNGSKAPRITLTAGRRHRLRVIGITSNATKEVSILQGADTARWRLLARDGAELTGAPEPLTPAHQRFGPGMIADYELTPAEPGELSLRVLTRGLAGRVRDSLTVPITVVAPRPSPRTAAAGRSP